MSYDDWKATDPADAEYREPPLRLVTCPKCDGEGFWTRWADRPMWGDPTDCGTEFDCEICGGGGTILDEHDGQPDEQQEWHDLDEDC